MKTRLAIAALTLLTSTGYTAAQNLYGNNAVEGTPYIFVMNLTTMAVSTTVTTLSGNNGRGVVVVGNTMYYTSASTNNVFTYNLSSSTNNGSIFTVPSSSGGLSTIAYDGTNLWIGDYSGKSPGVAYLYTTTGNLLKTVTLGSCVVNCDGLEYFLQGGTTPRLISNRGDPVAPYDIYDTNGNLITAAFISPSNDSRSGIAYDGTNFNVSDIFNGKIEKYSGTTGAFISTTAINGYPGGDPPLVEDLSANYAITIPTGTSLAPAPSTWILMACGLLFILVTVTLLRRRSA